MADVNTQTITGKTNAMQFVVLGVFVLSGSVRKRKADFKANRGRKSPCVSPEEWALLDTVAAYTLDPDAHFEALRTLHATSEYGGQVRAEAKKLGFA